MKRVNSVRRIELNPRIGEYVYAVHPMPPKPPAKSTKRVDKLRAAREALGLKRIELYAHPEDHPDIKAEAARLAKKRARKEKT